MQGSPFQMKLRSIKEEQTETRRLLFFKNTNYITEMVLNCRRRSRSQAAKIAGCQLKRKTL